MNLFVALSYYAGDAQLMLKNLRWQRELCGQKPHTAVLCCDESGSVGLNNEIAVAASHAYAKVLRFRYPRTPQNTWPQGPNWAFQHTAYHMRQYGKPWLWLEADAIPLKHDWLEQLEAEYNRAGKPFLGYVVPEFGHINGVACYPANTPDLIPKAMRSVDYAWDAAMREEMIHLAAHTSLIRHAWGVVNGRIHHRDGPAPNFSDPRIVAQLGSGAVLLHRDKGAHIVRHLRSEIQKQRSIPLGFCGENAPGPKVDIFIATCAKDHEYLHWNLKSIQRFASGFGEIVLAIASDDESAIKPLAARFGARLVKYQPPANPAYRHLSAQAAKAKADLFCPNADVILFTDSDCLFTRKITPDEYVKNGKPVLVVRLWAECQDNPWQEVTERALGMSCPWDCMVRHPQTVFPGVLKDMRARIESVHGKSFDDYVMSCKPTYKWGWSEHESIGAIIMTPAWKDKFEIIDLKYQPRPPDVLRQYWSWGAIDKPQNMPSEGREIIPLEDIQKILA